MGSFGVGFGCSVAGWLLRLGLWHFLLLLMIRVWMFSIFIMGGLW